MTDLLQQVKKELRQLKIEAHAKFIREIADVTPMVMLPWIKTFCKFCGREIERKVIPANGARCLDCRYERDRIRALEWQKKHKP